MHCPCTYYVLCTFKLQPLQELSVCCHEKISSCKTLTAKISFNVSDFEINAVGSIAMDHPAHALVLPLDLTIVSSLFL